MVAISVKIALLALASSASAAVVEKLEAVPKGWSAVGEPAKSQPLVLSLAMAPKNMDKMITRLYEISDPTHADYGKHYQKEELNAMIHPDSYAHDAVTSWLKQNGVTKYKSDGINIDFLTTVENANKMFSTKFKYYKASGTVRRVRTTEYSVPDEIAHHVDIVTPTVYFGNLNKELGKPMMQPTGESAVTNGYSNAARPCSQVISPSCLKEIYHLNGYQADPASGANVAFGSFLNQSAIYRDLTDYEGFFGLAKQTFPVELINGGINNQSSEYPNIGEANLDVQNIVGVGQPLPVREYITGGQPPFVPNIDEPAGMDTNEPYKQYYNYLLAQSNSDLPQVISNSYGDVEETVPKKYAMSVCNQIAQMGMRGITILEATGDTGVGAGCRSNTNGRRRFEPTFPASCPYVTGVGGTQSVGPEIAWTNGTGGFSDYFTRPSYQNSALNTYFNKYVPVQTLQYYQPFFNQNGRGLPDISAHSLAPDYLIVYFGEIYHSGGTSAATPVVAAILGLINDARFRQGNSSLGFINPLLYTTGLPALTDITAGGSVGCNGINAQSGEPVPGNPGIIPYASWNATVGWDPVTGLGTPNFNKLKNLLAPSS